MKTSLTMQVLNAKYLDVGTIESQDGSVWRALKFQPLESGKLEENFDGEKSTAFFNKVGELFSRLPDNSELQLILSRERLSSNVPCFRSCLYGFEKLKKVEAFSHLKAVLDELNVSSSEICELDWRWLLSKYFGGTLMERALPDFEWKQDHLKLKDEVIRTLSLTELPQLTWQGAFQKIFEYPEEFLVSFKINVPERNKIRRQLETKRRVSHALAISSSLEVRNIESNSVLSSSEETLERILVGKETLLETSLGIILKGKENETLNHAREMARLGAGLGNAGIFLEGLGCLPVFQSHLPCGKILETRKLPILTGNFCHIAPILHDYTRSNDESSLILTSRSLERSHLNFFSKSNLNYNALICGASGAGKSFLMQAILSNFLKDYTNGRICIFDVGGSYRKLLKYLDGETITLTAESARSLISTYLKLKPIDSSGFYRGFIETLCGSGNHITHSHKVAIDALLRECEGKSLSIRELIDLASTHNEKFYQDIAHWLGPHLKFDTLNGADLSKLFENPRAAFDFKEIESDPVLQKTTILILSRLIWDDLLSGKATKTMIVFDEVWKFFAHNKEFLEEMYRTLRKYGAGITSITQNIGDYGDDNFAKMIFSTSYTKIFLQNGANGSYLKSTFDLPESDIARALDIHSKKPFYSEFFCLTGEMSQIFRLYPTPELYKIANTENIAQKEKENYEKVPHSSSTHSVSEL